MIRLSGGISTGNLRPIYGRSGIEASLLGFSYSQNHNKGILFIAYAGARQIKKTTGTSAPLFSAVREGQRLGKAAAKIAHQDVEALMRELQTFTLLHGHTHRPAVHEFQVDGQAARRIVLGDWYEQGSVVRWDESGPVLSALPRA